MFTIANIRPFGHNVGNQAISFALRQMLYDVFGRIVTIIDYPATAKHETTAKAGISKNTVHEINRFVDGVIVGGGNLYENNEIDVDINALNALQPPLMLFSNSRGRIYGRKGAFINRSDTIDDNKLISLVKKAQISLSRDSATNNHILELGLKDSIGFCPTINLCKYEKMIPDLPRKENVGALISIRTPNLMNLPFKYQSRIQNDIETAINALRDYGHDRVRILCNDSRDLDFATLFKGSCKADPVFTSDVYQYLGLLKQATMVLSYRLHATLPAISFGTPTISISYDERAKSLFNDLGLNKSVINIVESNDSFQEELIQEIKNGGYTKELHTDLKSAWEEKSNFQFSQLERFKELMTSYVKS